MIAIRITSNLPSVIGRLSKFPEQLEDSAESIGKAWATYIVKLAKSKAPSFTGTLRNSIDKKQKSKKTWEVGIYGKASRYGKIIEAGFPPHLIPADYVTQHLASPGQKGQSSDDSQWASDTGGYFISKPNPSNTGFIQKSFNISKTRLPRIVKKSLNENIGK